MALYLVLEDFRGSQSFVAAQTIDDGSYNVPILQAEGLAVVPYLPTQDGVIATFLAPTVASTPTSERPSFTSLLLAAGLLGGGGAASSVIWEWNGTDTSQFDPVAVASAGQTAALSVSGPDLATNKAYTTLDMTSVWAPPGGGAAFRVAPSEGLVLPERFRLRFGVSSVAFATTRIGFMFFDPATWGANLLGGGMTYGSTYIAWIAAVGPAGGNPPFTLQNATPPFASVGTLDEYGGMLCEWDCTVRPGDASNPPSVACYGNTLGAVNGDGLTVVADRGRLIGDGNLAGTVPAAFNAASLTGLAIVSNSVLAGAAAGKISRLQILQPI